MPHNPAGEIEKLAAAHEELAVTLRQAAERVRQAISEARLVSVRIEASRASGAGKVKVLELPAPELFKGLTIGQAAEAFIGPEGRPIGNRELFEALKARGADIDSPENLTAALAGSAGIVFRKGHGWIMKPAKPKQSIKEIPSALEVKVGTLNDVKEFFRKKNLENRQAGD